MVDIEVDEEIEPLGKCCMKDRDINDRVRGEKA